MKQTLKTRFGQEIKGILPAGVIDQNTYKTKLKEIHTREVAKNIRENNHNPVLNAPAPVINPTEKNLPRQTRSLLFQLRSGYSSHLNSYLSRIRENVQNICPNCNQTPHDTRHLLNCPARPTRLTTRSLWENPVETAEFLELPRVSEDGEYMDWATTTTTC